MLLAEWIPFPNEHLIPLKLALQNICIMHNVKCNIDYGTLRQLKLLYNKEIITNDLKFDVKILEIQSLFSFFCNVQG